MKNLFEPNNENTDKETVYFWMNKYITLLEKYNELLLKGAAECENPGTDNHDYFSRSKIKKS